ncbi:MAG: hypothetical protein H0Z35_10880 [Thermoanaerobacteraceae bacterium]|nr:hypothetical protein [Thermoanaerobacteraceae bacterium]
MRYTLYYPRGSLETAGYGKPLMVMALVDLSEYISVYSGQIESAGTMEDTLNQIYFELTVHPPAAIFPGRPGTPVLCPGDLVEVVDACYLRLDSGWMEVTVFGEADNRLEFEYYQPRNRYTRGQVLMLLSHKVNVVNLGNYELTYRGKVSKRDSLKATLDEIFEVMYFAPPEDYYSSTKPQCGDLVRLNQRFYCALDGKFTWKKVRHFGRPRCIRPVSSVP